jgi:hypothetical protein
MGKNSSREVRVKKTLDYSNGSGSKEFGMDAKFQGPWAGLTFYF